MRKKDLFWIFLLVLDLVLWAKAGYVKGLSHNPRVEFYQTLINTPGFQGTHYNFFACNIISLDDVKGEAKLGNCGFKYIKEEDK